MSGRNDQERLPERRSRLDLPVGLAIGASTGGPRALLTLLHSLEVPSRTFIFLVQHIHPKFTRMLSRRLGEVSSLPVVEAEEGALVQPGLVYLAPGDRHLVIEHAGLGVYQSHLTEAPPRHGVRPSVDELFASVAACFGPRSVGVVLTGMGRDGLVGAQAIKVAGGTILAEAEDTCVVYGMPRVLAEASVADRLVPLGEMAAAIRQVCMALTGPPPVPSAPG